MAWLRSVGELVNGARRGSVGAAAACAVVALVVGGLWCHAVVAGTEPHWRPLIADLIGDSLLVAAGGLVLYLGLRARERTLREDERRLRRSQKVARVGYWTWEARTGRATLSQELQKILGLKVLELRGALPELVVSLVHPQDRDRALAATEAWLREGRREASAFRIVRPDGTVRHVWAVQGDRELDESGRVVRLSCIVQDVTERRLVEQALRESEARLIEAQHIGGMGNWEYDVPTGALRWSREVYLILDLDPEREASLDEFESRIHSSDRERFRRSAREALERGISPWSIDYRIVRRDGSVRHVHEDAKTEFAADGAPQRRVGTLQDVTEQVLLQKELHGRAAMLSEAQRIARLGWYRFSIPEGRWESSPLLDDIFGIAGGGHPHDVTGWLAVVHPDDRPGMQAYLTGSVLGARQPFDREYRVLRPCDGSMRWVHGRGELELDPSGAPLVLVGMIQDITERKLAEVALRESQERFRALFESAPDAIFVAESESGLILDANRAAVKLMGRPLSEIVGVHQSSLHPDPEEGRALFRLNRGSPVVEVEGEVLRADGAHVPVAIRAETLIIGDRHMVQGIFRDISERRRAGEERRRLEAQLNRAQRLESLGSLAGGVAHDMNNVLGAVLGLASAHLNSLPDGSLLQRDLETISNACLRGRTLVRALLDFSRPKLVHESEVDLNELVLGQMALLERTTLQRVRLQTQLESELLAVDGDADALSHALMNLCVNAVDAMPGGGTLTIATRNLDGEQVKLSVADTGCGMEPAVLERALEPFFSTKPPGEGTGLGLSRVYGTVRAHGGELEIHSTPGCGTQVIVRLPGSRRSRRGDARAEKGPGATPRGLKVLVIDDDDLVRISLTRMLGQLGALVTADSGGQSALDRLEAGLDVDLVVLDMNMPGLSGADTLCRLRSLRPDLPVILSTGLMDERAIEARSSFDGVTLLEKPFRVADLSAALADALGSTS